MWTCFFSGKIWLFWPLFFSFLIRASPLLYVLFFTEKKEI